MCQLAAHVFALSSDDLAAPAGQQQAVHAHIVDAIQVDHAVDIGLASTQAAARAVLGVFPGALGREFRGTVDQQASAAGVGATAHTEQATGIEVTGHRDGRAGLIAAGAADEGAAAGFDEQVGFTATPGDRLRDQFAVGDGLLEPTARRDRAHDLGPTLGLHGDGAACAVGVQPGGGDAPG